MRDRPTLNCADQSWCWMRNSVFSFLCEVVFLLNGVFSSLVAVHSLPAECGHLCWPSFVPRCLRVCLGGVFCSLTILVLHARLAPIHRLPTLGAFHALFLSSSPARDLHNTTWRLRFCLLEIRHQHKQDFAASHHLGHLCFSWHVLQDLFLKLRHVEEFPGCRHFRNVVIAQC